MIYHRQVVQGEKGIPQHLIELYEDTRNVTDNIHPQYNNLKSNYSQIAMERLFIGSVTPTIIGREFPFKILQDETISIAFDITGDATVDKIYHYVRLLCKGVEVFISNIEAIVGADSRTLEVEIDGTLQDGYIFVGIERKAGYAGSASINNLIIT
jgi:hypothetical protein